MMTLVIVNNWQRRQRPDNSFSVDERETTSQYGGKAILSVESRHALLLRTVLLNTCVEQQNGALSERII